MIRSATISNELLYCWRDVLVIRMTLLYVLNINIREGYIGNYSVENVRTSGVPKLKVSVINLDFYGDQLTL